MSLVDEGTETVQLYPAVRHTTDRGNIDRQPGADPVTLTGVWIRQLASSESPARGQALLTRYQLVAAEFPGGAWSKVTWNGDDYDVIGEPAYRTGLGDLDHYVVTLQARKPKAAPDG